MAAPRRPSRSDPLEGWEALGYLLRVHDNLCQRRGLHWGGSKEQKAGEDRPCSTNHIFVTSIFCGNAGGVCMIG